MTTAADSNEVATTLLAYRKNTKLPTAQPPIDHMVLGVISDTAESPEQAMAGVTALREEFVNWNECRVARRAELARILDPLPESDATALRVREMLNRLFDLSGSMSLKFISGLSLTEARRALLDIDGDMPRAIVSLLLFQLCPGATLPISPEALTVARKHGLVSRTGSKVQLQKTLLAELDPMEAGELVQYLELEAGGGALHKPVAKRSPKIPKPKKKSKAKTKTPFTKPKSKSSK